MKHSRWELASAKGAHTSHAQRWMAHYKAGAYDIDKTEPESMDLPEVCSFRPDDGLLELTRMDVACDGELIVVVDKEFGIIPVCQKHSAHCIRPKSMSYNQFYKQYLARP